MVGGSREWSINEDLGLLKMVEHISPEQAAKRIGRTPEGVRLRLQFLEDHEIVHGNEGEMTRRRIVDNTVGVHRDPPPYLTGSGQVEMNKTTYAPIRPLSARKAKE